MAITLLISEKDVKDLTSISGNIDPDYIMPQINAAQDMELEPILGTKLMVGLKTDIDNDSLTGDYLTLVDEYIKPCLSRYTLGYLIPYQAYQISNQGIYKHQSESSITPEKSEIDYLRGKILSEAQHYATRLQRWLCEVNLPEYNELEDGGRWADKDGQEFYGINL